MANLQALQMPTDIEPQQSFEALPAGRYEVVIIESELKTTKAGNGEYLQLTFEVVGASHPGRKLWARLNVNNPNKTAEEIAYRELAAICMATKVQYPPADSDLLHDIPLLVDVVQERNPVNDSMTNRIKGYAGANLSLPLEVPKPANKPAATARQPWKK